MWSRIVTLSRMSSMTSAFSSRVNVQAGSFASAQDLGKGDLLDNTGLSSRWGFSFTTTAEREMARDVKERWSCIALVGKTEQKSTTGNSDKEKTYEILGSNIITAAPYVSVNSKSRSS